MRVSVLLAHCTAITDRCTEATLDIFADTRAMFSQVSSTHITAATCARNTPAVPAELLFIYMEQIVSACIRTALNSQRSLKGTCAVVTSYAGSCIRGHDRGQCGCEGV